MYIHALFLFKAPPTKVHPSYKVIFQIHNDSKILFKLLTSREATPLILPLFHCRKGGFIGGDYCFNHKLCSSQINAIFD